MNENIRTLLVIGEDHESIAAKYSTSHPDTKYLSARVIDAAEIRGDFLVSILSEISSLQKPGCILSKSEKEKRLRYNKLSYFKYNAMSDMEFFQDFTRNWEHDSEGNAYSDYNPYAMYMDEKCYDDQIRRDQSLNSFVSRPFVLKDGSRVFSAKVGDVDWEKTNNFPEASLIWDLSVEGRAPKTDKEKYLQMQYVELDAYFRRFMNKEDFLKRHRLFSTHFVATKYGCISNTYYDNHWSIAYYNRFLRYLDSSERITLYDVLPSLSIAEILL